jgi:hypothetical protein
MRIRHIFAPLDACIIGGFMSAEHGLDDDFEVITVLDGRIVSVEHSTFHADLSDPDCLIEAHGHVFEISDVPPDLVGFVGVGAAFRIRRDNGTVVFEF